MSGVHRVPLRAATSAAGGRHKERNVTDHLPERERPAVKQRLRRAWALDDHARALDQLRALASELEYSYPGVAGSLREGSARSNRPSRSSRLSRSSAAPSAT